MKDLRVFISQPMNGRSEEEILEERIKIWRYINEINPYKKTWRLRLIDSYTKPVLNAKWPEKAKRLWCLGNSIQRMGFADLVVFAEGYKTAAGCIVEFDAAINYEIPIIRRECVDEFNVRAFRHATKVKNAKLKGGEK